MHCDVCSQTKLLKVSDWLKLASEDIQDYRVQFFGKQLAILWQGREVEVMNMYLNEGAEFINF